MIVDPPSLAKFVTSILATVNRLNVQTWFNNEIKNLYWRQLSSRDEQQIISICLWNRPYNATCRIVDYSSTELSVVRRYKAMTSIRPVVNRKYNNSNISKKNLSGTTLPYNNIYSLHCQMLLIIQIFRRLININVNRVIAMGLSYRNTSVLLHKRAYTSLLW